MYVDNALHVSVYVHVILRSDVMANGYLSQVTFHTDPVEDAIQLLEAELVAGVNEGDILQPLIDALGKRIEKYNSAMKQVRAAYDSWCIVSKLM